MTTPPQTPTLPPDADTKGKTAAYERAALMSRVGGFRTAVCYHVETQRWATCHELTAQQLNWTSDAVFENGERVE